MYSSLRRFLSVLLTALLVMSCLTSCYKDPDLATVDTKHETNPIATSMPVPVPEQPAFAENGETVTMPEPSALPEIEENDELAGLSDTQRNSINMLNHLVVLVTQMNASRNNRLYLEETYSQVLNNFNPEMVDSTTQEQLRDLLNEINSYRMITAKRERIQFLHEREQAKAYRAALPNPLSLMNTVQSYNPVKLLASVAYMAMDSVTSYAAHMDTTELAFIQSNWDLQDEEETNLHRSRSKMLDFMINMVREYELPGMLSLSEKSVDKFVDATSNTNVLQTIQTLESEQETYKAYGGYWLALANCYYTNGDYAKCLDAIAAYETLDIQIFRKDYELAHMMPAAIVSAGEVLQGEEYVLTVKHFADTLYRNTDRENWTLRYFAAQTYITLAGVTGDNTYLETAYDITLSNVNELVDEQKQFNNDFLAELVQEPIPEDATKEHKAEIKAYNKAMKELRATELAPISEPLYLNCELLFALADQLKKDQPAKELINGILHENDEPIFLVQPLDSLFYYTDNIPTTEAAIEKIDFNGKQITLPLSLISNTGSIRATVVTDGEIVVFDDWTLKTVQRGEKEQFDTFTAVYTSETASKFKYTAGAEISVEITPKAGSVAQMITLSYHGVTNKNLGVFNSVSVEKVQK